MAIHAYKILILSFILFVCAPNKADAQNCNIVPEVIHQLYEPRLGTYSLWDIIDGVEDMSQIYNDFIMLNEAEVILAGAQQNDKMVRPIIRKFNRKGRVQWTWQDKNQLGFSRPIEIVELIDRKEGFLAIGQVFREKKPHAIWIGEFSSDGSKKAEYTFSEPARDLTYGGLTKASDGKGWILAATEKAISKDDTLAQNYSRFIRLNSKFQRLSKRSFLPGPENSIHQIKLFEQVDGEKFYIAAGEMGDGFERSAGLVMRLDMDMNIVWHRLYPRGGGMRVLDMQQAPDHMILITGIAKPIDPEAPNAGVAMKLDAADGNEIWQRYFMRDDVDYESVGLVATKDGRSHYLLKGMNYEESEIQGHARIITLSPRGEMMSEISYTAGREAIPIRIRRGINDLLTISGQALMEDPDPKDPENKVILRKKGWLVVGEPFGEVNDPCKIEERPF